MKNSFALPSCNYNLVLSQDDLRQLLDKGYITVRPGAIEGTFVDDFGSGNDTHGHHLTYGNGYRDEPVQFICIRIDK